MCVAISLVLMITLVEWRNISRWYYQSTPPHPWSLCNGPKSWGNVSQPTFPFHVLATFAPFHSTFCFQMQPAFHLALELFRSQSWKHQNGFQNPCQSQATSTLGLSPKCLSRFRKPHCILHPIHKFRMIFSKGLSKAWLSLQNYWRTCDNKRPILRMTLKREST